jgi:hypothetical protein
MTGSNHRFHSVRLTPGTPVAEQPSRQGSPPGEASRSENDGRLGSPVPCPASERGAAPATKRKELTRSKGPAQGQLGDRLDIASCVEVKEGREDNRAPNQAVERTAIPGRFRDHKP